MNGWDLFTWIMIVVLAGGSTAVFLLFLAELRSVLRDIGRRR
jgi:hypothetical protein